MLYEVQNINVNHVDICYNFIVREKWGSHNVNMNFHEIFWLAHWTLYANTEYWHCPLLASSRVLSLFQNHFSFAGFGSVLINKMQSNGADSRRPSSEISPVPSEFKKLYSLRKWAPLLRYDGHNTPSFLHNTIFILMYSPHLASYKWYNTNIFIYLDNMHALVGD